MKPPINNMKEEVNNKEGIRMVLLFLEKLEKLTEKERATLIKTIDILNTPIFVANNL